MISSAKANRALRKGRNNLFERDASRSKQKKYSGPKLEANTSVVKQLREKYRQERRQELVYWLVSFLIGLTLLVVTWMYLGVPVAS